MNNLLSMATLLATSIDSETQLPTWVTTLINAMTNVINPVLIVAAVVGVIYAVWVGIVFIKADDKNAREEAKQKLIYVIVGVVVTGALIALFYWLAYALENDIIDFGDYFGLAKVSPTSTSSSGLVGALKTFLNAKL